MREPTEPRRFAALQRAAAARAAWKRLLCHAANVGVFAFPIYLMASFASFESLRFDPRVLRMSVYIDLILLGFGALAYGAGLLFTLARIGLASRTGRGDAICFARLIREREGWSWGLGGLLCQDGEGVYFLRGERKTRLSSPDGRSRMAEIEGARAAFLFSKVEIRPYLRFEGDGSRITIDALVPAELVRRL